jgi:hypothetical protein
MSTTRRLGSLGPALGLVLSCTLVFGCTLLKKKSDPVIEEDPPVADAPKVTVTGSGAKNEKDVLRYGTETKIADEPAVIAKDGAKALTFPASGADVATLAKGTEVVKIAKFFSTGVLVLFDDPTTADGTKLMGWVTPAALAAPTAAATATATATAAPVLTAAPKPAAVDAGAKILADAGVVDAGARADAGKVAAVDAGVRAPAPLLQVLPTVGRCPAGFVLVTPFCRRPCAADKDCPTGSFCTSSAGKKTCSATK